MKHIKRDLKSLNRRIYRAVPKAVALRTNKETWEVAASKFHSVNAIPKWGPFGIGEDISQDLIGKIKGKVFLEIACGSGHSIDYLVKRGAKKVYGVDIAHAQIEFAKQSNLRAIEGGKVELYETPMETRLDIGPVDTAFSIYGIGWTTDPKKLFKNVYSYLKPGGKFVWSWDHTLFSGVEYKKGKYVLKHPYHEEKAIFIKGWSGGKGAHITYRKTATWFKLLSKAGFRITDYLEPAPRKATKQSKDPKRYYSIHKAKMVPSTMIFICEKPRGSSKTGTARR